MIVDALKVLGIGDAVLGMLQRTEPWHCLGSEMLQNLDTDSVRDAVKPLMLTVSGMLLSPGS